MQTSYIYSVSRVNTLSEYLLSKTDIERLLVADPGEDLRSALKETYLAPYIVQVPGENFELAVEKTLIDAKRLIHRIAPEGDMFRVLWIQYDIHNLRVLAKASAKELTFEECKSLMSERGVYDCEYLYNNAQNGTLSSLQPDWQQSYDQAIQSVAAGEIDKVDGILDELYYRTSLHITDRVGDSFMRSYLQTLIDLNNLKARLRVLKNESFNFKPAFVAGGTIAEDKLETEETTLATFAQFGGADYWKEAIEYYQKTGNTTSLDARSGEYMIIFTKEASYGMFTSASLVLYYLKCRQAAANIRNIVVGINSGKKESAIRANLRMAYVNE
ncbi:V-type ATPase subunit [Candidatus Kaiserbacteria bacterium]|nr:V-type ATPase subunit [Candidatus Kaiserbacteria bacterium]